MVPSSGPRGVPAGYRSAGCIPLGMTARLRTVPARGAHFLNSLDATNHGHNSKRIHLDKKITPKTGFRAESHDQGHLVPCSCPAAVE